MLQILYGIYENTIDVTDICFSELNSNDIVTIPYNDIKRNYFFKHSFTEVVKSIFIVKDGKIDEYDQFYRIEINTKDNTLLAEKELKILYGIYEKFTIDVTNICFSDLKNNDIITIPFGDSNRNTFFSDVLFGEKKYVIVITTQVSRKFNENHVIKINLKNDVIEINSVSVL